MNFLHGHIQTPSRAVSRKHKSKRQKMKTKDMENVVLCSTVERYVFRDADAEDRKQNRGDSESASSSEEEFGDLLSSNTLPADESSISLDEDSDQALPALGSGVSLDLDKTNTKPAAAQSNGTDRFFEEQRSKTRSGMVKAEQKEIVKRAARRGCVFGFALVADPAVSASPSCSKAQEALARTSAKERLKPDFDKDSIDARRKCEVVSNGRVVEPSFAKGDWGVRWRESGR